MFTFLVHLHWSYVFQDLPRVALDVYLAPSIARQTITVPLDTAIPIHQTHQDDNPQGDNGATYLHHLRTSKDPLIREYYEDSGRRAAKASFTTKLSTSLLQFIEGTPKENKRWAFKHGQMRGDIHIRAVTISIRQNLLNRLNIGWGNTVVVRCEVNPNEPHEKPHATSAKEFDAARRLAISFTAGGKTLYMQSGGDNTAQRANGLVNKLEDVSREGSERKGRGIFTGITSSTI